MSDEDALEQDIRTIMISDQRAFLDELFTEDDEKAPPSVVYAFASEMAKARLKLARDHDQVMDVIRDETGMAVLDAINAKKEALPPEVRTMLDGIIKAAADAGLGASIQVFALDGTCLDPECHEHHP